MDELEREKIRVLIIAQFEAEFERFKEYFFSDDDTREVNLSGLEEDLFVREDGVAGIVGGMGKAQAASTLSVLLACEELDFSEALILSTGCAGGPLDRVTLGDVVISNALVDFELGHHFDPRDLKKGEPEFVRFDDFDTFSYFEINPDLARFAARVSEDVELEDFDEDGEVAATRAKRKDEKLPKVRIGLNLTGDNFWHGNNSSSRADLVAATAIEKLSTDIFKKCWEEKQLRYLSTQCEDNALAIVAKRFSVLDNFIAIRDIVNYDSPAEGVSVVKSADERSGAFELGNQNGFLVCKAIVKAWLKCDGEIEFHHAF